MIISIDALLKWYNLIYPKVIYKFSPIAVKTLTFFFPGTRQLDFKG